MSQRLTFSQRYKSSINLQHAKQGLFSLIPEAGIRMCYTNRCSKKSRKIHGKTFVLESLSNRLATLWKKRLWHRSFLMNFGKCLRTPFLRTLPDNCFWVSRNICQEHLKLNVRKMREQRYSDPLPLHFNGLNLYVNEQHQHVKIKPYNSYQITSEDHNFLYLTTSPAPPSESASAISLSIFLHNFFYFLVCGDSKLFVFRLFRFSIKLIHLHTGSKIVLERLVTSSNLLPHNWGTEIIGIRP